MHSYGNGPNYFKIGCLYVLIQLCTKFLTQSKNFRNPHHLSEEMELIQSEIIIIFFTLILKFAFITQFY